MREIPSVRRSARPCPLHNCSADEYGYVYVGERSVPRRERKPGGYLCVNVIETATGVRRTVNVGRLVAMAHDRLPLPGEQVRHLNGNCQDDRLENLAWGTPMDNTIDKWYNRLGVVAPRVHYFDPRECVMVMGLSGQALILSPDGTVHGLNDDELTFEAFVVVDKIFAA